MRFALRKLLAGGMIAALMSGMAVAAQAQSLDITLLTNTLTDGSSNTATVGGTFTIDVGLSFGVVNINLSSGIPGPGAINFTSAIGAGPAIAFFPPGVAIGTANGGYVFEIMETSLLTPTSAAVSEVLLQCTDDACSTSDLIAGGSGVITLAPSVPEPASMAVLGMGLVSLAGLRKRRLNG